MKLEAYLFYYGRCEEALEFYKGVFGGSYELNRFEGSPMAGDVPAEARNKVMHATFTGGGITFMASDGSLDKTVDPDAGNISLSLGTSDEAEGKRVFDALSQGGKVGAPLNEAFWGGKFGMVVDKFGVEWMMSIG
jgi:PhnB protein